MQRKLLFLACFFVSAVAFAQEYPFVYYTPRDGLVSNRVKSIYQDSKGRIYFITQNGLSVYDGSRFTNYTSEDGLQNDVVNFVMEMGDDSVWVVSNSSGIDYLSKGKLKDLVLKKSATPVINYLCRDNANNLYAAADEGLFVFQDNSFEKVPFIDSLGKDVNQFIISLIAVDDYLLCLRDPNLSGALILYLYSCRDKKIVSQSQNIAIQSMAQANDGRIWLTTENGTRELNLAALHKGKIILRELPFQFKSLSNKTGLIFFDNHNNTWLIEGTGSLTRCDINGNTTAYNRSSGLNANLISFVFNDRENIIWLASDGGGVAKLMHSNITVSEQPFGLSALTGLHLASSGNDVLLYSQADRLVVRVAENGSAEKSSISGDSEIYQVVATPRGLFGIGLKKIFRYRKKGRAWQPELLFKDSSLNHFGQTTVGRDGNLLITGEKYLTAVLENNIFQMPVNYLSDQVATDKNGNVWVASRKEELVYYSSHPENPAAYLRQEAIYKKELEGIAPRSIAVDGNGSIWIGTRHKGIFVFRMENEKLNLQFTLTSKTGLSENFVSYLVCDEDNTIWACTPSGLDKVTIQNGKPVIENLTRQNNIYESIVKVVISRNKTAWALAPGKLVKIMPETLVRPGYIPRLMFTQMRAGANAMNELSKTTFTYKQNNLSFYFAAPSFLDEKQIHFSYLLQGSSNNVWSEPSNNSTVSFVDLKPGNYALQVKAIFPAGRYPDQMARYSFSITPPWWQTWWFRTGVAIFGIGMLIAVIRLYYLGKLERQKTMLEKQQAVERERTRIATDMHDDLGAGLSRIKFLSETIGIKKQKEEPIEDEISSIRNYSHEMIDKMGEIVWALNEKNDSLIDLLSYTRAYAVEYLSQNGIKVNVKTSEKIPDLFVSGEFRRNIYLTVKEALHNIVKHSQATCASVCVETTTNLYISIQDNGSGFDEKNVRPFSNGIANMKKRISSLNGHFELKNTGGSTIIIVVPLP